LQREWNVVIDWAPFLLDPSIPIEGKTHEPRNKPGSLLTERGSRLGIEFRSGRTFTPNSLLALQASAFARDFGSTVQQLEFHKAMFKAHFTDVYNLSDRTILNNLGATVGLDGSALNDVLTSEHYLELVKDEIDWTRKISVTSIPTFIFENQYAVVGAQEYEVLEQVAANIGVKRRKNPDNNQLENS
tara:strand:- start:39 stop:599 length:561 start_codon:yes stop_codon:yes gene_type:complete